MTHSQRALLVLVALLLLAPAGPADAEHHEKAQPAGKGEVTVIEAMSTMIGGKNVFLPSTIAVVAGEPHVLSIYNSTDVPHGFSIPDLDIEVVLPPKEEYRVELPPLEGDAIHAVRCHLHPPHRSAQLLVLDD